MNLIIATAEVKVVLYAKDNKYMPAAKMLIHRKIVRYWDIQCQTFRNEFWRDQIHRCVLKYARQDVINMPYEQQEQADSVHILLFEILKWKVDCNTGNFNLIIIL